MINFATALERFDDKRSDEQEDREEKQWWEVVVRPPEDTNEDPREIAEQLYADLHGFGRLSYEIHSNGPDVALKVVAGNRPAAERVARHIQSEVGAQTDVQKATIPIDSDDPVAAAEFKIEQDVIFPLETVGTSESEVGQLHHLLDSLGADDVRGTFQVVAEPVGSNWTARRSRALPASVPGEQDTEQELKRAGMAMVPLVGMSILLSPWPIETAFLAGCALVMAATVGEGVSIPEHRSAGDIARAYRDRVKEQNGARASQTKKAEQTADEIIEQASAPGWRASIRLVVSAENRMVSTDIRDGLAVEIERGFSSTVTGQELSATRSDGSDAREVLDHVQRRQLADRSPSEIARRLLGRGTRRDLHIGPGEFGVLGYFPDKAGGGGESREFTSGSDRTTALPASAPAFNMAGADGGTASDYLLDDPTVDVSGRHAGLGNVEIKVKDADGEYFAGEWLREITENATRDSNIVLGTIEDEDEDEVREVALDEDDLDQHMFIVGASGAGKSTLAEFLVQQYAHAGRGMCIIDPHNEFVDGIRKRLPEHRKDDVILIDPEGPHDKTVTINFLDVELSEDHPDYEAAVNAAVSDLVGVLRQGTSNVGDRMEDVVRTVARGMIRSPVDYTLLDMQRLMTDPERREDFAARMASEGREHIARAAEGVAELSNDDLAPVARLFNEWVMSPVSRQIIEQTESSFSFAEAVENDRIILVRGDLSDDNLARQTATTVYRGVMRACEDRDEEGRKNTFPVVIDETDDIYTPEMNLASDLGNARKYGVSLTLMTQYPKSLKPIQDSLETNCKTFVSYACPSRKQARPIASMFGCDSSEIQGLGNYVAQVQLDVDGVRSGPYRIDSPAPIPPIRTEQEAIEEIDKPSLERFGVDPTDVDPEPIEADGGEPDRTPVEAFLAAAAEGAEDGLLTADPDSQQAEDGKTHFTWVHEGTAREQFRINPSRVIEALEEADREISVELDEVRGHARQAVDDDDSPVVGYRQRSPPAGRCVGVALNRVNGVAPGDFQT